MFHPARAIAQQPLVIKSLAEKRIARLPDGPQFWRIEEFGTRAQARAAEGDWALSAESAGRFWVFTLGPAGGSSAGGKPGAELGPIAGVAATQYLLRINEASGPPGSVASVHSHPGSEAFFVLSGRQGVRSPQGLVQIDAGKTNVGHGADSAMQVSSSGSSDLLALVMFVVDGTRPYSSPAALQPSVK